MGRRLPALTPLSNGRAATLLLLLLTAASCRHAEHEQALLPPPPASTFPVTVNVPEKLTRVESGQRDALGRPTKVACVACHSQRESGTPRSVQELDEFHAGMTFDHGGGALECVSCHAPGAHDRLRLASGRTVPLVEVMTLCAQCHGPQYRDYRRGSHGGMSGYWDLSKGPRLRNNCVDCHDPHAPAYPSLQPAAPPRSRFTGTAQPGGRSHD